MVDPDAKRRPWGRRWLTALLALVGLLVAGVLSLRFFAPERGPPPPRFAAAAVAPAPETSTIVAPIDVPLTLVEDVLEDILPRTLFELDETLGEGVAVSVTVARGGAIKLGAEAGRLIVHLPVDVAAGVSGGARRGPRGGPPPVRVTAGLHARAAVAVSITDDWHLATRTTLTYRWTSRPTIRVGARQRDIAELTDHLLARQMPRVGGMIDDAIRERDPLRPQIERAWDTLSRPQQLRVDPPVWLVADPEALFVADPAPAGDVLHLAAGLAGRFRIVLGDAAPQTAPRPLPARAAPPAAAGVRLNLSAALGWDALSATASEALAGRTWTVSAATLTPGRVTLYPSGERVVIGLGYAADVAGVTTDGTLYCQGKLVLDAAAGVLRVDEFDYLLDTWDETIAGANALAQSGIREAVRARLEFRYADALVEARARVTGGIADASARSGGMFTGSLDVLEPRGVRLTEDAVVVDALLAGALTLRPTARPPG